MLETKFDSCVQVVGYTGGLPAADGALLPLA